MSSLVRARRSTSWAVERLPSRHKGAGPLRWPFRSSTGTVVGEQLGPRSKHREKGAHTAGADGRRHAQSSPPASTDRERWPGGQRCGPAGTDLGDGCLRQLSALDQPDRASACRIIFPGAARVFGTAGTMPNRSLLSSPIWCRSPLRHGQVLSSRSTTTSIRWKSPA